MLHEFRAEVADLNHEEGSATVRLIPYGHTIQHQGQTIQFDAGSLRFDGKAPVNLDHGANVLDHIGIVERFTETADGAYAVLKFSDTVAGRDTRTLLLDGVIEDVSAGVMVDADAEYVDDDGVLHRKGSLHHVAIVRTGAFGSAGAGSKVLSVHAHDQGGSNVSDDKAATSPVVEHAGDDKVVALTSEVEQLRQAVAELSTPGAVTPREPELTTGEYLTAIMLGDNPEFAAKIGIDYEKQQRNLKRIQQYALAKDNTTVGAGVVPAFAKSEVISIVDANRPINSVLRKVPIEQYGMTLNFPIVATKPSVAVQSAQHDEPDSTQIDINSLALTLGTYAGASDVAIQLLERSMPSYLQVLYEEYAHVLAQATEVVASDALIAGAGGTAVLASLATDAGATVAAVATRKAAIVAGTRQPATHIIIGTTRLTQLESLVDTTDRPLLHYGDGMNSLGAQNVKFMGMDLVISPDATATDCIIINANRSLLVAESAPQFFNVDIRGTSLSVQLGIYQYYGTAVAHAAGIQTLTPS